MRGATWTRRWASSPTAARSPGSISPDRGHAARLGRPTAGEEGYVNQLERFRVAFSGDVTLADLFDRLAKANGDAPLVEEADTGLMLTFAEAADRISRASGGIREKISEGDPVIVNAPNGYEFFMICLAIIRAGGTAVPVNPQMRDEEIEYVKGDSGASLIVQSADEIMGEPVEPADASPDEVAGIFYTSGTTGKP